MRANAARPILLACILSGACSKDQADSSSDTTSPGIPTIGILTRDSAATCFVADRSVLARAPNTPAAGPANLRGWIRLDRFGNGDSAAARLIDSDGFAIDASWRRVADSILVTGSNDFVKIEMRLHVADSVARGSMHASSDAALERDSAGKLREFRRDHTIRLVQAACDSTPNPAGVAAIDVLPEVAPRPGIRFDPASLRKGTSVGALVLDSITVRQAVVDSTHVGMARFRGEIRLSGWTMRHPDPDANRVVTCFEADSSSASRLPRWRGDERRPWFCFSNRVEAAQALGPPSEGVPATIVVDQFTIHRGMSDEVNSARFLRLVRGGKGEQSPPD